MENSYRNGHGNKAKIDCIEVDTACLQETEKKARDAAGGSLIVKNLINLDLNYKKRFSKLI